MSKTKTVKVRVDYRISGTTTVEVDREAAARLLRDEPEFFDPDDYIGVDEILEDVTRGSGRWEVEDWDLVGVTKRDLKHLQSLAESGELP